MRLIQKDFAPFVADATNFLQQRLLIWPDPSPDYLVPPVLDN
jgi:hypothetical protein